MRWYSVIAAVAGLLLAAAGPAAAQTLTGTVVEEGTEEPVAGAIVSLLDASDDDRSAVLTGPRGEYEIGAPRPGRYRLRVERIGYRTVRTETVALDRGERVARRIVVPLEAIEISAIELEVEDRCATRPDAAETLGIVWEEARKALEATRLTRRKAPHRFEIERIERLLDPRTRLVLAERVVEEEALGRSPFRTRPSAEVTAEGWATMEAQRMQYYGPDVEALLSDDFLDRHCFRLARGNDRIGIEFEPVGRGSRVEIRGILWIDDETRELKTLEFAYVGLPYEVMESLAGGTIDFDRLADGRWIIRRWRLQAPEIALQDGEPRVRAIVESEAKARRAEGGS